MRKNRSTLGREREPDDPDLLAGTPFVGVNHGRACRAFATRCSPISPACERLGAALHRAIAVDLGLEPNFFASDYDRSLSALRVLHYPPHPGDFDGTPPRRRAAHRLRRPHAARARRCRRSRSAPARRHMDRGRSGARYVRVQHRRCADALDQRRVRLERAPRRQPLGPRALFRRLLLRTESRRGDRLHPGVRARRAAAALSAGPVRRVPALAPRYRPTRTTKTRSETRLELRERDLFLPLECGPQVRSEKRTAGA